MLRFARATDGVVAFDVAARLPGRGAWVCAGARCLDKAVEPKQGGFARAFDAAVVTGGAALAAQVRAVLRADVLSRLGLLRRAGDLVLGRDEVARRQHELSFVALADDLSDGSRREVDEQLGGRATLRLPAMAEVGAAVGGRPVGVVGARAGGAARALEQALGRWSGVVLRTPPASAEASTPE
jgi:predicted RNA-binding protein YlxR (DUF448 family)